MKKSVLYTLIALLICAICVISACSGNKPAETTTGLTDDAKVVTTMITPEKKKPLAQYSVMGNEYRTELPFENFFVFMDSQSIYTEPSIMVNNVPSHGATIRVKVIGLLPELMTYIPPEVMNTDDIMYSRNGNKPSGSYFSYYKVKVVDLYGYESKYKVNGEYMVQYVKCPQVQVLYIPSLDIGSEYILHNVSKNDYNPEIINMTMWFKIQEYNGVEYVYPYFVDCSPFENNLPMTEPGEDEIQTYPDIVKYMDDNGIEHPKFKYKFELNDFIAQMRRCRGLS